MFKWTILATATILALAVSTQAQEKSAMVREIEEAARLLRARGVGQPETGIVLGTGLGSLADALDVQATVPYRDIPHFPTPGVESHAGEWVFGTMSGRPVVVMRGRAHYYEGYTMRQVTFPVRVLRALVARSLVLTGAAGGLNPEYEIVDTTPTVMRLFGFDPRAGSDGVPLMSLRGSDEDPVDLHLALEDEIADNHYPDIVTNVALSLRTEHPLGNTDLRLINLAAVMLVSDTYPGFVITMVPGPRFDEFTSARIRGPRTCSKGALAARARG